MSVEVIKRKANYRVYIVVGIVVVAAIMVYAIYPDIVPSKEPTINILTYESFFQYGSNPNQTLDYIINNFENWYHVKINVETSSGDLYNQIIQTKGSGFDVVIGLNNIDSYLAANSGFLYKFNVSNESHLNKTLYSFLQSSGYVIPYEYSPLTTDYNLSGPINVSVLQNLSFADFSNSTVANQYILENPTTPSINGEDFLLGQIAFYSGVLHQNWTSFWNKSRGMLVTQDWSSGFSLFESGTRQMFFSYSTDPAYNEYFNYSKIGTTPFHYEGKNYAWMQVLGIGILNSSKYKSIDKEFVNWFIGQDVQNLIPLNEWTYPANMNVALPEVYSGNPPISSMIPLNSYLNMTMAAKNLAEWSLEWSSIES
ncbi:MAG: extracellular solute-binding protein [Thermoplasmatales archaeon]|nr:extracellular solute-binding protein [Candidatus Thermoplasmatota archaeon]MDA8054935.1 extracellular solute-binding protein [Thermoplasmatales archaeon]